MQYKCNGLLQVEAIIRQRDMFRVLLSQSDALPVSANVNTVSIPILFATLFTQSPVTWTLA